MASPVDPLVLLACCTHAAFVALEGALAEVCQAMATACRPGGEEAS